MISVPLLLKTPPPENVAVFDWPAFAPPILQLLSVSDGPELKMPPPLWAVLLPNKLQSVSVSVPLLSTAPPSVEPATLPLAIVRPVTLTVVPELIVNIRKFDGLPAVFR